MKIRPVVTGLGAGLLFGIATPVSKMILSALNSFQLAGLLYFGAAIAFVPFLIRNGRTEFSALKRSDKKLYLAGIVLFGGILGPVFLMIGLKTADAMSVSIWLNLEMAATAILGVLFFKDHLDRYATGGLVLTLIAGILISLQETGSGIVSGMFVLIACIFWGLDNHLSALVDGVSPQTITFIKGVAGGITNLTTGMILSPQLPHPEYIPLALLTGVFSYGISIAMYVSSAQNLGATRSQMLFSTAPFWGIITAWILLGETVGIMTILSFIILSGGIFLMNLASHTHEHLHHKMVHIHEHSHNDDHHDHFHEGISGRNLKHAHLHEHKEKTHAHLHFPDLHHRHEH